MSDIDLLLLDPAPTEGPSSQTRFGGLPSTGSGFHWPVCKTCSGNMQFLGQIRRDGAETLQLIFMCQNEPGLCSEWEADGGGNAVVSEGVVDLQIAQAPAAGETLRATLYGARVERVQAERYDTSRDAWAERNPGRRREVLGQVGGEADWLQGDETPNCDQCRKPMRFVAQLEEGPDYQTSMNFGGGGCAYLFDCDCGAGGKFLWQS